MTPTEIPAITIERTFKAPPDQVWRLWTTPSGLEQWWGPIGFVSVVKRLDLRQDGGFEIVMRATGAQQLAYLNAHGIPLESTAKGVYTEIDPPRRLAWRNIVDFVAGVDRYDVRASVDFAATLDGGTTLTFRSERLHDAMWTRNAEMGWTQQLDRLATALA